MKYSLDKQISQFIDRLLCEADDYWGRYAFSTPEPEIQRSRREKALTVLAHLVKKLPSDEFRRLRRYVAHPTAKNHDLARKYLHLMIWRGRGRNRELIAWGECSLATARTPARQFYAPKKE